MWNRKCERQTESSYAFWPSHSCVLEQNLTQLVQKEITWLLEDLSWILNVCNHKYKKHKPSIVIFMFSFLCSCLHCRVTGCPLDTELVGGRGRLVFVDCGRTEFLRRPDVVSKEEVCKEVQLFEGCLTFEQMFTLPLFGAETTRGTSSVETMAPSLLSNRPGCQTEPRRVCISAN